MISVGVIDSGGPAADLEFAAAILPDGGFCAAEPDQLGHGTAVADVIKRSCADVIVRHAQVFTDKPVTSAARVAGALEWFARTGEGDRVDVICLSLGLSQDRSALRDAVHAALEAGILIVAATPARGAPCFPAAYPGVIGGTGDTRCRWGELSRLDSRVFGAWSNSPEHGGTGMAGASVGCARVAGHLCQIVNESGHGLSALEAVESLSARSVFIGPEQKVLLNSQNTG